MSNPYELFSTNKNLEAEQGVDLDYGGFTITIHRAGGANKKFERVFTEKMKPYMRLHEVGGLGADIQQKILLETYCEAVIVGWSGVTDKDGKEMKFTYENCVKLMSDLPDLFRDVQEQAKDMENFKLSQEGAAEKN